MKNKHLSIGIVLAIMISAGFTACKKDTVPSAPNPPVISLNNDVIISTLGGEFYMEADLTDEVGLKNFNLRYDDWYLYNTISLGDSGNPKSYHVKYKLKMPDTAANKIHSITLTATNVGGNSSTGQFKVLLNSDFPSMYLVESTDASKLTSDLFGVPAPVTKISSYNYEAIYYSRGANATIWFVPSKTVLKPFLYGIDPDNSSKFTGDYAKAKPVVLPGKGYFKITFNTLNLSYKVEPVATPSPANAYAQAALVGRGFYDYPNMDWQNALPNIILLDKDADNPYLFTKTVKLGVPPGNSYNTAQFIITTNNGWSDFWRFDNGTEPEKTVFGGGTNADIPITTTPVSYKVIFDSYLNTCKFERQ